MNNWAIVIFRPAFRILTRWLAVRKNVSIGANFKVGWGSFINSPGHLDIGADVSVGKSCWISCSGSIGSGVLISSHVGIVTRQEHDAKDLGTLMSRARTVGPSWPGPNGLTERVTIGDDCWIGFGAIILSGLHIGRGSVVGAGAVVTKDVPPYGIVVGNPAKLVGMRLTESERIEHERRLSSSVSAG